MPVEDDARVDHGYWSENCGRFMTICSTHAIELGCVGPDDKVRTPDPPPAERSIFEGLEIELLHSVRIVEIVDKVKLWGHSRIDLRFSLRSGGAKSAFVVVRKL